MGFSQSDVADTEVHFSQIDRHHGEEKEKLWKFHCRAYCKMHLGSDQIY